MKGLVHKDLDIMLPLYNDEAIDRFCKMED